MKNFYTYFNYKQLICKRILEDVCMFPFILMGRLIAWLKPLADEYEIFFFFPFFHVGGAEKVHAEIANVARSQKAIIFFTKKSHNNIFYDYFKQSGCAIKDVSRYTDNKWLYVNNFIYRGMIAAYINKQRKKTIVFNGQCNFGYKIARWIRKDIPQIELIHSFNTFSYIRIPFIPFYRRTVMISKVHINNHYALYDKMNIPAPYKNNIQYIINGIQIPFGIENKRKSDQLNILYVGRGTSEKRIHLIGKIAERCIDASMPVVFSLVGDVENSMNKEYRKYCSFLGPIADSQVIKDIYLHSDILLMTSNTEGFPMTIMEAMAYGLVIISTAVGDIPIHVRDGVRGFLIDEIYDENIIVEKSVRYIASLICNKETLQKISAENCKYAASHFDIHQFNISYKQLFNQLK